MKAARIALLAFVCTVPLAALAQWQWLDKDGRKVFSDKAPPPEIAPNRIVKAPRGFMPAQPAQAESPAPAGTPATATATANLPKPAGKDRTLEERKKRAEAVETEKKKAEDAKYAALRADNCSRAKIAKANFSAGMRIARVNDKGERVILDESQRASELQRLDEVITRDCS
jgi:hypothetical protein